MQKLISTGVTDEISSLSNPDSLAPEASFAGLKRSRLGELLTNFRQVASSSQLAVQPASAALPDQSLPTAPPDCTHDQFTEWWQQYTGSTQAAWLRNGVNYTGYTRFPRVSDPNWQVRGVGDFNGDGNTDILWQQKGSAAYSIALLEGATELGEIPLLGADLADLGSTQLQGIGDFNGDSKTDLLWRNFLTGENTIALSDGFGFAQSLSLPSVVGSNMSVEAVGDFNQDGKADILWRNYLSGEVVSWLLDGATVTASQRVATAPDLTWQIETATDLNGDGKPDLLWRNSLTGQGAVWGLDGLTYTGLIDLPPGWDQHLSFAASQLPPATGLATITNLSFSGQEGDRGTFQIQLNQAPTTDVVLGFDASGWLTIDTDADLRNGSQNMLVFTPLDWNLLRTVSFIAEVDGSSENRLWGNTIAYSLSGGLVSSGVYELATVTNTSAPDPTRFNIDLDFRNDSLGFWTPARQAIARQAANDWASRIANEWTDFQLDNTIDRLDSDTGRTTAFATKRHVDDLVLFINNYQPSSGGEGGLAGPDYEFGGWWTPGPDGAPVGTMPRVGQVAINPAFANYSDLALYQVLTHEIGHTLGLLGLNWTSYTQQDLTSPETAVFTGAYATAANGGAYVPLQSQDGGDYSHPGAGVNSIMSYGWLYRLSAPSAIDFAFLADSGYKVYGINA